MSYPKVNKIPYTVNFGNIDDKFRGSNITSLADPIISHNDDYFWIRDDSRTNQKVLDLIKEENDYTNSIMQSNIELQNTIYNELKLNMNQDYKTFPLPEYSVNSQFKYFKEYQNGFGYYLYKRLDKSTNLEITLLDINKLALGKEQCDVTNISHSLNEIFFSYCVDYNGSEKYELIIQNLNTMVYVNTSVIPLISYGNYKWINNDTIIWIETDSSNRPYQIWLWNIKTRDSLLIYEETNCEMSVESYTSSDMRYIFISSSNYDTTVVYYIDTRKSLTKYHQIHPFVSGLIYYVDYYEPCTSELQSNLIGDFYIRTNSDDSINWKICKVPIDQIGTLTHKEWPDFIKYNENIYINSISITKNYLLFTCKINGSDFINIVNLSNINHIFMTNLNGYEQLIEFNQYSYKPWCELWIDTVYTLNVYSTFYNADYLYLTLESMTKPFSIYKFNLDNFKYSVVYVKEIPNYIPELYKSERIYVELENDIKIPISLVYHKDKFNKNGSAPLYLYGYGSYGNTVDPDFDSKIIPLLNRGWIYAIGHVRGGSFLGYDWYENGKLKNKLNTFTDFIACAEYLINIKYAHPDLITIDGRSAGGLLVGASMTMKPELFKNVIMGVPFVDVLNTMCDSTIPLTVEEWSQWGNPNIADDYNYMKLYCPYTNLKETNYPNIYITTGLYDPRVQYWEPLKFITKLRGLKTDSNIQLIKINTEQGHFGGSDRYKYLEECAEQYTFILTMNSKN